MYPDGLVCSSDISDDIYEEITIKDALENRIFCKWVNLTEDKKYMSHYDRTFEYKFNEIIEPKKDTSPWSGGNKIYCCLLEDSCGASYSNYSNSVLVELKVMLDDIIEFEDSGMITVGKCVPVREISKEEYEKLK